MVNKENNMKTLHISIISAALSAFAGVPISRTVDVSATIKPVYLEAYAGETLDLSMQLASGGAPLSTPSAAATIYWQTNGMSNAWWQTNLACSASGLVSGAWSPSLPSGKVWFFVGLESSGLNYRISGQCAILQSPGSSPSTAVLPPPGGTLNLGDYTIIGAPWITSADSAAAIASATAPIATDVASLSSQLSLSSQASSNYTASVAGSVSAAAAAASNYTDSVAAPLAAATNALNARLDSLSIPDVSGFASKSDLHSASNSLAVSIQGLSTDLSNTSNALAQATSTLAQTVSENAQQSTYDLAATSNALAQATATLAQTVSENAQQAGYDLAATSNALAQSTATLAQTVAYNAQQAGYDLVAASNALAQSTATLAQTVSENAQQATYDLAVTSNALSQATESLSSQLSLSSQASSNYTASVDGSVAAAAAAATNYTDSVAANLTDRIDSMSIAFASSNTATRLSSPDGSIYQDATGVVWRAENFQAPGLFSFQKIGYYTNGVYKSETNALPAGIYWWMYEGYDNGQFEILAGEIGSTEDPEDRYRDWMDFTNHVDAADMEDTSKFYYLVQLEIAGELTELTTNGEIDASTLMIEWPMSDTNTTRYLVFARTNVTANIQTPIDRVLYASSGGGGGMTTNDVCSIVTNEVATSWKYPDTYFYSLYAPSVEWITSAGNHDYHYYVVASLTYTTNGWYVIVSFYSYDLDDGWYQDDSFIQYASQIYGPNATKIIFEGHSGFDTFTITRNVVNAIGLAYEKDLPQNKPVDEILFNGADGKVYRLRIGAGGSVDIYTEVAQ